jgi:hypothetical protein
LRGVRSLSAIVDERRYRDLKKALALMKFLDKFLGKNETLKCGIYSTHVRRSFAKAGFLSRSSDSYRSEEWQ